MWHVDVAARPHLQPHGAAIRTRSAQVSVCGVPTNLLAAEYSNRIFVLVSQAEHLGTLIHAWRDNPVDGAGGGSTYSCRVLIGRRDDEALEAYARTLIELIGRRSCRPLLLAVSVKEHSPELFRGVMRELEGVKVW